MSRARAVVALLAVALLALASASYVPSYVMLNLDAVTLDGNLKNAGQLQANLQTVKNTAKIDGFVADVWWGIVEGNSPQTYKWTAYQQMVQIARAVGLKIVFIMSFHQCGGNVGDACDISIPGWILSSQSNIYYKDREGNENMEYISLGADNVPLVGGRTPIQMYADFVESFTANVLANATDIVTQVQIGQGPAGELRYPSYPLARWSFPGIGEFQMYDQHMLAALATYAASVGHPEWGNGGPDNAGTYNSQPGQTGFFADYANGNYASGYGKFFLRFYFESLLNHSTAVLSATTAALGSYRSQVMVSGKVAGIHWLYKTTSHAAECTAGYINTNGVDPYKEIAKVFAQFNALMDFTCLEMLDSEQPSSCACSPQYLVAQVSAAANAAGAAFAGENALPRFDQTAYNTVESAARAHVGNFRGFYYLRLGDQLLQQNNLQTFAGFVSTMHNL